MPRGDRTGPMGMGAMTGRAAGLCADFGMPGYSNPTPGQGFGMGFGGGRRSFGGRGGGGRGRRNMFYATGQPGWMRFGAFTATYGNQAAYMTSDPAMEKQNLRAQANALESELNLIHTRLDEIERNQKA